MGRLSRGHMIWAVLGAIACAGCDSSTPCVTMKAPNDLVTRAALLRLDVYGADGSCAGTDAAPGSGTPTTTRYPHGEAIALDVPPGRHTLVLFAFADAAGTILLGSGCVVSDVAPGAGACLHLAVSPVADASIPDGPPVMPPPDIATPPCDGPCECVSDDDCKRSHPALPHCTAAHTCAECATANDCKANQYCTPQGTCADGCEPAQGRNCPNNARCCGHTCLDTSADLNNCGACGNVCAPGQTLCCDGKCANPTSDATHCGACNVACSQLNGTPSCNNGSCAWACNNGWAHCANVNSGCETKITTLSDCGGCGNTCIFANASGAMCDGATCSYTCAPGFADCNAKAPDVDGCETAIDTVLNCGSCGMACGNNNTANVKCTGGACIFACKPGFADCNANPISNGCETNIGSSPTDCGGCGMVCGFVPRGTPGCTNGVCTVSACAGFFRDCDGVYANGCETDVSANLDDCGACGVACGAFANGNGACIGGKCTVLACNPPFRDCNQLFADGCEADPNTDVKNCGGCGVPCQPVANASIKCVGGNCAIDTCAGTHRDCDGLVANGCEIDISVDAANCGACSAACPAVINGVATCVAGQCGAPMCLGAFKDCDSQIGNGCEVDTSSDINNCGGCGVACPAVANGSVACMGGKCVIAGCAGNYRDCDGMFGDGCETDISSSTAACGGCGMACPAIAHGVAACTNGACGIGMCAGTFRDCDGMAQSGCEVDIGASAANCGGCGMVCPAVANGVAGCAAGVCGIGSCSGAFRDCDGNAGNGCEVNTGNDLANCGACNKACAMAPNANVACAGGACVVASCGMGFLDCDAKEANGCECQTPACCGASCQPQHLNGLGQSYYDCSALGTPGNAGTYTMAMATEARAAWPFVGNANTLQCPLFGGRANCVSQQANTGCAVWCYTNDRNTGLAGHVNLNTQTMFGGVYSCICPTVNSPTWN